MININAVEIFGYFASILVAISFLMKSIKTLRLINIIGSTCFVIYSIAIHAWPVALINTFIVGINLYHIFKKTDQK